MEFVTYLAWYFFSGIVLLCLEILLAQWGILFCSGVFLAYYIAITFRIPIGLILGFFLSCVTEILLARRMTTFPVFICMLFILSYTKRYGDRRSLLNQLLIGVFLSILSIGYLLMIENFYLFRGWSLLSFQTGWETFLFSLPISTLYYPLLIRLMDWGALFLGLDTFQIYGPNG